MKRTLTLIAALSPLVIGATTLGLHIGSQHDKPGFNDTNPGVYIRLDNGSTFGTVLNSMNRQSFYAGMTWDRRVTDNTQVSLTAGGITGYAMPVTPMVIPSVAYRVAPGVRVRGALLFRVHQDGANAIHMSIEKEI